MLSRPVDRIVDQSSMEFSKLISIHRACAHSGQTLVCRSQRQLKHFTQHAQFEQSAEQRLHRNCFALIRLNGNRFSEFAARHRLCAPNDKRSVDLLTHCSKELMRQLYPHIPIAYGFSDEFTFVIDRHSRLFDRKSVELSSYVSSLFSGLFVFHWPRFFTTSLQTVPAFPGTCFLLPSGRHVYEYVRLKQNECHHRNLHSTLFHALLDNYTRWVASDSSPGQLIPSKKKEGQDQLDIEQVVNLLDDKYYSQSSKNELLFSKFNLNYNNEPELFRKGSFLAFSPPAQPSSPDDQLKREWFESSPTIGQQSAAQQPIPDIQVYHQKLNETFWKQRNFFDLS